PRDIEVHSLALQGVGFDSSIKEAQRLIVLSQLIVDDRGIDIDLPGAQQLPIANKDLARGCRVAQGLSSAVQAQARAYPANARACPANLIADCQKLPACCVQKR